MDTRRLCGLLFLSRYLKLFCTFVKIVKLYAVLISKLMISLIWACLSVPVHKYGVFPEVLSTRSIVSDMASAASLSFCRGLFEAIQSSTPSSLEFFENLPLRCRKRWGIYVLVLKKSGGLPYLYIGSGTNMGGCFETIPGL